MRSLLVWVVSAAAVLSVASGHVRAQIGATVPNWSVPSSSSSPGTSRIRALGDATNPLPFIGVTPCRIVDTRGPAGPFGAPAPAPGSPRSFSLSAGPCSGLPVFAGAYSLNITATNTTGPGFFKVYPFGGTAPVVSTLNYIAGQTVANAAIVPAGIGGGITVAAGVSRADLIIDINGYFNSTPVALSNGFLVANAGHYAISGQTAGSGINDAGVYGLASSTTGVVDGVWGQSDSTSDFGIGVLGTEEGTSGVTYGVYGRSVSTNDGAAGVYGEAAGGFGATIGVEGVSSSGNGGTGVRGVGLGAVSAIGVRGDAASGTGVRGFCAPNVFFSAGVVGEADDGLTQVAAGALGLTGSPPGTFGVYAFGNMGASGTKPFIEVHPTDPNKVIRYVALEGPEAGTYFRGSDEIRDGMAVIPVPESFRLVTDKEGLTVQITPIGAPAAIYVVAKDLDRIVVRSDRDVRFDYLVQGVRQTFKDWQVMVDGGYMPESPEQRLPAYFSEEQKRRLIANGTYNADGTVNMSTAERVGWTKIWAQREAERAAAGEEARKQAALRRSAMMR
jgi:hypothetical protein